MLKADILFSYAPPKMAPCSSPSFVCCKEARSRDCTSSTINIALWVEESFFILELSCVMFIVCSSFQVVHYHRFFTCLNSCEKLLKVHCTLSATTMKSSRTLWRQPIPTIPYRNFLLLQCCIRAATGLHVKQWHTCGRSAANLQYACCIL